jgi:hypothetical protein
LQAKTLVDHQEKTAFNGLITDNLKASEDAFTTGNRHPYRYEPLRPMSKIDADLRVLGQDTQLILSEVIT